jgi:tripartite-type tricarboxylate transporter receptor subunit TctC
MENSVRRAAVPQNRPRPPGNDRHLKKPSSVQHSRRRVLRLAAGAAALPTVSLLAWAQGYPSHPVTMVVAAPAGGGSDAVGRVVAEGMRGSLGQPIIIQNVSGADGSIGTGRVARARPDGYTIQLGITSTHMMNGAVYPLPYDVVDDFAPISPLVTLPVFLFARKTMPAKDLIELIAWLKANPNMASAGLASSFMRLATAFFRRETATQFTFVPYRGEAPAIQDLVAGPSVLSHPLVRAGSIKAYAVASETRSKLAPDIPAFGEMGLPFSFSGAAWYGIFAPKGTPAEIIDRLNAATVQALVDPAVRSRLADLGTDVFPREQQTPKALGAFQKAQIEKWWPLIKEFGIKAE